MTDVPPDGPGDEAGQTAISASEPDSGRINSGRPEDEPSPAPGAAGPAGQPSSHLPPDLPPLPPGVAIAPGGEFLYRAGELLVAEADLVRITTILEASGGRIQESHIAGFVLVQGLRDTLAAIDSLEAEFGAGSIGVEPNIVVVGGPSLIGGPATRAVPAAPPPPDPPSSLGAGTRVGVFDTGIAIHPIHQRLAGRFSAGVADEDVPNQNGGPFLAAQGGHGTFVAGLVNAAAPATHLVIRRVLDADGFGDVFTLAQTMEPFAAAAEAGSVERLDVLNLSLGGYGFRDRCPALLATALRRLTRAGTVVVAAAGNNASARPFWPAALAEVVGVGALSFDAPAPFSNVGPWVDACAVGVDVVSTFFDETGGQIPGCDLPDYGPLPTTFPGYARWSGTSFAAPKVAGAVAAATTCWGVRAPEAARRLVGDWRRFRVPDLGIVVTA